MTYAMTPTAPETAIYLFEAPLSPSRPTVGIPALSALFAPWEIDGLVIEAHKKKGGGDDDDDDDDNGGHGGDDDCGDDDDGGNDGGDDDGDDDDGDDDDGNGDDDDGDDGGDPPCFTPGTMIATPKGEVTVEDLKVGDKVITRDNGMQTIRWIGARTVDAATLTARPELRPVAIEAGALGNGLPERKTVVSPQHRILFVNDTNVMLFDEREVLLAARHLVGRRGIAVAEVTEVTYIHIMFDRHEVVLSNSAWTESFQPGDRTLKGMDSAQRAELLELFPDLETAEGREAYTAARKSLKRVEAMLVH